MNNEILNSAKTLLETGMAMTGAKLPADSGIDVRMGIPYVVVPNNCEVKSLEHLLEIPLRKRATVDVSDFASFVTYAMEHGDAFETMIYAEIDSESSKLALVAVMNDHSSARAGWRDHLCRLRPRLSVEWRRWTGQNKARLSQAEFAAWIEDNLQDIAGVEGFPSGADMLAMALGFEKTAEKRLKSRINLQSGGVRFEYVDDEDKDTRTSMQVFERFTIGIPVFYGSASAYPVEARLKYREKDGKLDFWFELIRPDRVFKTAAQEEVGMVQEKTGMTLINGTPGV